MSFSLFKKQLLLSSLIPTDSIDIHNHLLPGIDDGSKSPEQSMELLDELNDIGFTNFVCTPHTLPDLWENTNETILSSYDRCIELNSEKINHDNFRASSEYYIHETLIEKAKNNALLPLKDNTLLIEMSYLNPPINLYELIFELQNSGYDLVLAHPERYRFFHSDFKKYENLKSKGIKFQLNLLSTIGYYGKDIAKIADKLLKHNLIDYTGTDAHHLRHVRALNKPIIIKQHKKLSDAIERTNNEFKLAFN